MWQTRVMKEDMKRIGVLVPVMDVLVWVVDKCMSIFSTKSVKLKFHIYSECQL